jgi:hypothetical protein
MLLPCGNYPRGFKYIGIFQQFTQSVEINTYFSSLVSQILIKTCFFIEINHPLWHKFWMLIKIFQLQNKENFFKMAAKTRQHNSRYKSKLNKILYIYLLETSTKSNLLYKINKPYPFHVLIVYKQRFWFRK